MKTLKSSADSADAIKDYGPVFMSTEESLTIPIEIVDDLLVEGDETFTVEITPLIGRELSSTETYSVIVTIKDNDGEDLFFKLFYLIFLVLELPTPIKIPLPRKCNL